MERVKDRNSEIRMLLGGSAGVLFANSLVVTASLEHYRLSTAVVVTLLGACIGLSVAECAHEAGKNIIQGAVKLRGRLRLRNVPLDRGL